MIIETRITQMISISDACKLEVDEISVKCFISCVLRQEVTHIVDIRARKVFVRIFFTVSCFRSIPSIKLSAQRTVKFYLYRSPPPLAG